MTVRDEGDVLLQQTEDGGDITLRDGQVVMTKGPEVAAYLSLFGGNADDDGRPDNDKTWWGNRGAPEDQQYRGRTGYLVRAIAPVPANLRRIEDAARDDLAWMTRAGAARSIEVVASMPGRNQVRIAVSIDGGPEMVFSKNWQAKL